MERIQKILARAGIASRRHAEELIRQERVKVNGKAVMIGDRADAGKDTITVDGKPVRIEPPVYYAFYKPAGVVTTMGGEHG
jgi:23S rRNA pseudouridine2605 synthase